MARGSVGENVIRSI